MKKLKYYIALGLLAPFALGGCASSGKQIGIGGYFYHGKENIVNIGVFNLPPSRFISNKYVQLSYDRNGDGKPDLFEFRHVMDEYPPGARLPDKAFLELANSHQTCATIENEKKCYIDSNTDGIFDREVIPGTIWLINKDGNPELFEDMRKR